MQNLKETDLCFQKWHEECGKFSLEHLKVSKMELWWDAFIQGRKSMSLKFTGELCVMAMKNDSKLEKELTCYFKIDMRNWRILTRALGNLKKLHFKENLKKLPFKGLLLTKVCNVWAKKYRGVMLDGTEDWCRIWRKLDLCSEEELCLTSI